MPAPEPDPRLAAALRALPDRVAPAALERRVLAELAARAARPWWRRSLAEWPRDQRSLLLLLLVGAVAGGFAFARSSRAGDLLHALAQRFPWLAWLHAIGGSLADTLRALPDAWPREWLYYGAAGVVLAYGLLLGLGTAAYRAFFRPQRSLRPLHS